MREAYREEFQEFGGGGLTRDTMLDAPAASGGVARAVADETSSFLKVELRLSRKSKRVATDDTS